ncbi:hypothetical protein LOTGIDRAFT_171213 [Lottia gigantea]|uniref:Formin GTPase-binding domain-containing protein n=1 Tax=Lottia gigantea TaxID=225164 RepID=V4B7T4_LOTGI|nr:hypothetical protein LOTGIDRAFT_171213 [Lottia gigantea]ESP03681.1 hypothetical protein LOTGIDRAFT_171213 [Lottia gigantea]
MAGTTNNDNDKNRISLFRKLFSSSRKIKEHVASSENVEGSTLFLDPPTTREELPERNNSSGESTDCHSNKVDAHVSLNRVDPLEYPTNISKLCELIHSTSVNEEIVEINTDMIEITQQCDPSSKDFSNRESTYTSTGLFYVAEDQNLELLSDLLNESSVSSSVEDGACLTSGSCKDDFEAESNVVMKCKREQSAEPTLDSIRLSSVLHSPEIDGSDTLFLSEMKYTEQQDEETGAKDDNLTKVEINKIIKEEETSPIETTTPKRAAKSVHGIIRKVSTFLWGRRHRDDMEAEEYEEGQVAEMENEDAPSSSIDLSSSEKSSSLENDHTLEKDESVEDVGYTGEKSEADDSEMNNLADDILGHVVDNYKLQSCEVDPLGLKECNGVDIANVNQTNNSDAHDTFGKSITDITWKGDELNPEKEMEEVNNNSEIEEKLVEPIKIKENMAEKETPKVEEKCENIKDKDNTVENSGVTNMSAAEEFHEASSDEICKTPVDDEIFSMSNEYLSELSDVQKMEDSGSQSSESNPASSSDDPLSGDPNKKPKEPKNKMRKMLKRKVEKSLSNADFDLCEPEICVSVLSIPSVKSLTALKKKITKGEKAWIQGFLDAKGLDALLDNVDTMSSRRVTNLSDALMLLECVSCIKSVSNSKLGLEALVHDGGNSKRIIKGE